ncbi:hypothetical protein A2U01_0065443 [Trifolium medium]|uniref:Uncharacterized protein n=1 Tax=Trifolium medium TaxID=97028 RepID=A0A392S7N4_9FABA|nr:hypothetical protein [Trifolium medium]
MGSRPTFTLYPGCMPASVGSSLGRAGSRKGMLILSIFILSLLVAGGAMLSRPYRWVILSWRV